ncbi:unnamed protein product [Lepeophtheirus salmonis]|nr:unnamed protein product [Lepeophtheirus salmonis]CAF2880958.1 unnamed protein product [Lepeophtheirus salmonis]
MHLVNPSFGNKLVRVVGLIVSQRRNRSEKNISFYIDDGTGVMSVSYQPHEILPSLTKTKSLNYPSKFNDLLSFAHNPTQNGQSIEAIGHVVKFNDELFLRALRIRLVSKNEEIFRSITMFKEI